MGKKLGEKDFDITLELFANMYEAACSMIDLQQKLKEELNRDVSISTIYYKKVLCKKAGMSLKKYDRKPRKKEIDVEALNRHPSIKFVTNPPPTVATFN